MPVIKTINGDISYTIHPLYLGIKRIDKIIAKENLLLLKEVVDRNNIPFELIAGTLLGAVREHDFIDHDEDIDLCFLEEDKQRVFGILPELLQAGFEIARYDRRGLMSVIRKGEYIDFYFFVNFSRGIRSCSGWCIPERFLLDTCELTFQGKSFKAPKDYIEYLEYEYGSNWNTPIPYSDFNIPSWKIKLFEIKSKIKDSLPDWLYFPLVRRSEKKLINSYLPRAEKYINPLP